MTPRGWLTPDPSWTPQNFALGAATSHNGLVVLELGEGRALGFGAVKF